ncbi:hypothetical protein AM501_24045 [Aneurinibacillus migulanus]|uniref:single-stranded DNA-binding protein n=1 Tax=Aneurinibacillus migulanus TaxID=47500 RepID=UPI0005BBBDB9|nr:single-stranded DNA-binding protein [Aneurinibacillus migulanus]KIV58919.1 hypothetical protein TS64_03935 [Aneurinibacillus migulanus]KPD05849.1 hypothetical protein AM501_24045 [Aneurinibacillus migulanus]CEH28287.1 Single-stranded DNA-binding protein [Aneurinibacillus migulanus]
MLNRAVLLGRLTRDPELRYTPTGTAVCTFVLAIPRRMVGEKGDRETDFLPIVVWNKLAELCAQYLRKGQQAAVEGRIQVRNFENKEGQRIYVTEIVADNVQFLNAAVSGGQSNHRQQQVGRFIDNHASWTNAGFNSNPPPSKQRSGVNFNDYHERDKNPDDILKPGEYEDDGLPF